MNGDDVSYLFHVDEESGQLLSDHFGGTVSGPIPPRVEPKINGWVGKEGRMRREFPDQGRGDFRSPAVRIRQSEGYTVSDFQYKSYSIIDGKPGLPGLPSTFGGDQDVTTLVVHLFDNYSSIAADLSYSVFPKYDAVVRSVNITNRGDANITVEGLSSISVDLPFEELDMISLRGDWARENKRERKAVAYGLQG